MVVVPKADRTVRLCGDYKVTVNQTIKEQTYPLPNTEDLFATLAGGKNFTKLDLSQAYQQLELTEESKEYLTFITHKGLYRYHRLPFGVSAAPSIFQSVMDQTLAGLDNVCCFLDDILISGKTIEVHHFTLNEVLTRLEKLGFRVKKDKCEWCKPSVEYLGHRIDSDGLHPTDEKVKPLSMLQNHRMFLSCKHFWVF